MDYLENNKSSTLQISRGNRYELLFATAPEKQIAETIIDSNVAIKPFPIAISYSVSNLSSNVLEGEIFWMWNSHPSNAILPKITMNPIRVVIACTFPNLLVQSSETFLEIIIPMARPLRNHEVVAHGLFISGTIVFRHVLYIILPPNLIPMLCSIIEIDLNFNIIPP